MPRPSLLPAALAAVAVALPAVAVCATALPAAALPAAAPTGVRQAPALRAAPEPSADPLRVTIDSLTPGEVPDRGRVRMRGTVTNVSNDRWRAINVHAFIGESPMTTATELAEASLVPPETFVGGRITVPGTFDSIGSLLPGETASFTVRLPREQIPVQEPGVYWFGAHALGNTTDVRDEVADGRARTFLPLVPEETRATVDTSLVIPVRRAVRHTRGGRILGSPGWARALSDAGSLQALAELGVAAGDRDVSFVVDPAVPDAVQQLVEGNLPRNLGDTVTEGEDPPTGTSPSAAETSGGSDGSGDPSPSEPGESGEPEPEAPANVASEPGAAWLEELEVALTGNRVLSLPYGDPDVSATTDHGPALLGEARNRAGERLAPLDVPTLPVVAPPGGFLSPEALAGIADGTTTVLSDLALPEGRDAAAFEVDGRRVLFASSGAASGGPGPDDPLATVAMRQRILAEGAVRLLGERPTPLVVMPPQGWTPEDPRAFFDGLDVDWLDLTDVASLTPRRELAPERLDYPAEQRAAELPAANVEAATRLLAAGETLANVLTNNDQVDREVADEALTSLSYSNRRAADQVRELTGSSASWLERRLSSIRVQPPRGVTLSSATGGFATTLTNRLDHPVTISLTAITDAALSVETPATIDLAPRGSQTVVLRTEASAPGVHYARLVVTDDTGAPLGSSASLPVRSAQVSDVIWVILGVGVGLLFLAIAVRLVRRIRSERG